MAVTEVNTLAKGTWGPRVAPGWNYTYQITTEAFTNDANDSGLTVLASPLLPGNMFHSHPDDSRAYCIGIDPEQDEDDATYWVIVYHYSTRVDQFAQGKPDGTNQGGGGGGGGGGEAPDHPSNPLDRKPKVRLAGKMFKRLTFRDLNGQPIVNSAGSPYEGVMLEIPRCVIHVTRNIASFEYDLVNECKGGVNMSPFLNYEVGRVKCEELTATEHWELNQYFWEVQGEFIVANEDDLAGNPTTSGMWWYEFKLDAGYDYLNSSGVLTTKLTAGGQKPGRPWLLNGSGGLLNNTGLWTAGGALPWYNAFKVLREVPLNALGLFD